MRTPRIATTVESERSAQKRGLRLVRALVLGPLTMCRGEIDLTPSAPKLRQLLALLLLKANAVVPASVMTKELWYENPPASAVTTLQTYVVQIRRSIAGGRAPKPAATDGRRRNQRSARDVLATEVGGYQLRIAPDRLDLWEYQQASAAGSRALAEDRLTDAVRLLSAARALWRGPALVDVQAGEVLRPQVMALDESHITVIEQCIEALMRSGRHLEVISDLTGLVAEHRYHEFLHARLMLALHRCGRRQEALAVFYRLRHTMIAELGFEPSRPVQELQRAILADDPDLSWTTVP
jgi:DNA-binding SARP family transcriptional activator